MTHPIGEESIRIVPDASGFRAALQAQIGAALPAVQRQVVAAQRNVAASVSKTAGGVILPAGAVKGGVQALEQATAATAGLGAATKKAAGDTAKLTASGRGVQTSIANTKRIVREAEQDLGRYTRGMTAATLASTGFFRAVSFASGAFLIGAAVGASIGAAVSEFRNMTVVAAQTTALIKATGGSANTTAGQIDALAKRTLALTGIDDELVKQAANVLLCLEESAEALTRDRGWVSHNELSIGDEILAYDPEDDTTRWEPVLDIYRYHHVTELMRWKSKQIDVATTPHHRWWTTGRTTTGRDKRPAMQDYRFRTTEEVTGHQFAVKIGGGKPGAFRDDPVYSDDLVELAAWVFTEGSFSKATDQTGMRRRRREALGIPEERVCLRCGERRAGTRTGPAICSDCRTPKSQKQLEARRRLALLEPPKPKVSRHYDVSFCQSVTANPENVARIRALLDRFREQGHRIGEAQYVAHYNNSTMISWSFAGRLGGAVRLLLPGKKLTPAFLTNLTASQANLFLDVLIRGDGRTDHKGHKQFIQKDETQLDLVAMLAAMLGIRTSRLGRGDSLYFCTTNHFWGSAVHAETEHYNGIVWCPQIRTQIFLARNRGRTFWTGNTFRGIRNEVGKGNDIFNRAVKGVVDISSVFKTDLRGSAVQVGKALQDPVRGVTALRRSGITLSQAQRELIKRLVETGRTLTAQKVILHEVEVQVGGTAEAIGRTLPGRLAIMREEAKNSLGEFVKRISESRRVTNDFVSTTSGIGQALKSLASGVAAVVKGFAALGEFTGLTAATAGLVRLAGGLRSLVRVATTAVVIFAALKLALGAASIAEGVYARATTISVAATAEQTAAAALLGKTVTATTERIGIGAALMRTALGPVGLAVGLTALTVGFIKLRQEMKNQPGTINATRRALDALSTSVERAGKLTSSLAGARENVSLARFDVIAAQRGVNAAQGAINTSRAAPGSVEQLALANRLVRAQNALAKANKDLALAEQRRDAVEQQLANNERSRPFIIESTTKALQKQIDALGKFAFRSALFGNVRVPGLNFATETDSRRLQDFNSLMDKLIAKGTPLQRNVARVLRAIEASIAGIPSQKQLALVVRLVGQGGRSIDEILSLVGAGRGTEAIRARGLPVHPETFSQLQEDQFRGAQALVAVEEKRLKTAQRTLSTQKEQTKASRDSFDAARETQRTAIQGLADAQRSLSEAIQSQKDAVVQAHQAIRDAINQSKQSVTDAINSAKANLDSLGQSLSQMISTALGEIGGRGAAGGVAFHRLRDAILGGTLGGPADMATAARTRAQIAAGGGTSQADRVQKTFAALSDELNRGIIKTMPQFNRRLRDALSGVDLKTLRKLDPVLARKISDYTAAVTKQARQILAGPNRPGGGDQPTVVNIAATIRQGISSIAAARVQASRDIKSATQNVKDAERNVSDAQRALAKAQRDLRDATNQLRKDQIKEGRLSRRVIAANTKAVEAQNKLLGGDVNPKTKDKKKPTGRAGNQAREQIGAGAAPG